MKPSRFLLLPISFALVFASCSDKTHESEAGPSNEPFENFYFQRSFPDEKMNMRAFDEVAGEVKSSLMDTESRDIEGLWTQHGPKNIGGRINCIAVNPNDQNEILTGSATGGIFRTTNGGENWEPIGDDFAYMAIGDITYDPSNPNTIYAGTGDPNISGLPHVGNGIYKSIDGGETWENMGLEEARIISRIAIDPTNTEVLYVSTMGLPFEEGPDRGVYKSTDGGETWSQILFIAENAGVIDLLINPENPEILYAAGWNRIRNNTMSLVSGEDARIWRTQDGGVTWNILDNGLPMGVFSRIGLDISPQSPDRLIALYTSEDYQIGGIYGTTDGGDSWSEISWDFDLMENALGGFGWYFGQIRLNPWNDEQITILGVNMFTSNDYGSSWYQSVPPWWTYEVHADKHDLIWLDENTALLATDGGLYKSTDGLVSWEDIEDIPNTQFYRIATNPHSPGYYTGGTQDNGTTSGNVDLINDWNRDYGGDGFQPIFDPEDSELWYAETQNGGLVYNDGFDWSNFTSGIDPEDRRNWDMPIIMSSHTNDLMYTGTYRLYRNTSPPYGSWDVVSEDLTDGVIYGDRYHNISTIGESRVDATTLYVGTSDGNVWRSLNGGNSWVNITIGLPERYVSNIKTSADDPALVYVSHNGYKDNDNVSHIHRSFDYGDTWEDISGDLPDLPITHIEVYDDEQIFVSTDFGVYFTSNAGENWERVGSNMPMIPVFDIEIDEEMGQLVAGTFARSLMTFPLDSLVEEDVVTNVPERDPSFSIWPNPTTGQIILDIPIKSYSIYDQAGNLVMSKGTETRASVIDVEQLPNGLYTLIVEDVENIQSSRFVKL